MKHLLNASKDEVVRISYHSNSKSNQGLLLFKYFLSSFQVLFEWNEWNLWRNLWCRHFLRHGSNRSLAERTHAGKALSSSQRWDSAGDYRFLRIDGRTLSFSRISDDFDFDFIGTQLNPIYGLMKSFRWDARWSSSKMPTISDLNCSCNQV